MAGIFILFGLAVYQWVSVWGLIIPAFVGANLLQFGITGFCPAEYIFGVLGLPDEKGSADAACHPEKSRGPDEGKEGSIPKEEP